MVAMVLAIAIPTFAQILPQGEPGVTDPVGDGGSVPEDVTSTQPSSSTEDVALPTTSDAANDPTAPAEGGAAHVIPITLSNELCAELTDPLVASTFERVVPDLVKGCLYRVSIPDDTAPVNPAPVEEPGSVEPAPVDTTVPADTTAPVDTEAVDTEPTDTTAPVDTTAPLDTIVPSV